MTGAMLHVMHDVSTTPKPATHGGHRPAHFNWAAVQAKLAGRDVTKLEDVADATGVSLSTLDRLRARGAGASKVATLLKIRAATGISLDELVPDHTQAA